MAIDTNINLLSPTGFKLVFAKPELKGIEFYLQSVDLPVVSVGEANYSTPRLNIMFGGDKLMFDPFTANIMCDEKMENFSVIYDWLNETIHNPNHKELVCDASLVILTSANNLSRIIEFKGCYPNAMSGIAFDAGATDIQYASFSVTFRYDYYIVQPQIDLSKYYLIPVSIPVTPPPTP